MASEQRMSNIACGNLRTRGSERLIEYVLKFFATFWHQKVDYKFKFKLTESTTVRNTENFKEKIIELLKGIYNPMII